MFESAAPVQPELLDNFERSLRIDLPWIFFERTPVSKRETDTLATAHGKVGSGRHVLAVDRNRSMEDGQVRTGDRAETVAKVRDPGNGSTEVKAQRQLHPHGDPSAQAFDDAEDVGMRPAGRHEVDQPYGALGRLEGRFEDQGVGAVAARGTNASPGGCDLPIAVFFTAQATRQSTHRRRSRASRASQSSRSRLTRAASFAVADQGIVFDFPPCLLVVCRSTRNLIVRDSFASGHRPQQMLSQKCRQHRPKPGTRPALQRPPVFPAGPGGCWPATHPAWAYLRAALY